MEKAKFDVRRKELKIIVERLFDATPELVFKVSTDPKLIPEWWGPKILTTKVEKDEIRPGGLWRYVQHDKQGKEYAFNGKYIQIVAPELISRTFEFEGMPGHVTIETCTIKKQGNNAKMIVTIDYKSIEDLEGMLNSGMKTGMLESWDRLAELLAKVKKSGM